MACPIRCAERLGQRHRAAAGRRAAGGAPVGAELRRARLAGPASAARAPSTTETAGLMARSIAFGDRTAAESGRRASGWSPPRASDTGVTAVIEAARAPGTRGSRSSATARRRRRHRARQAGGGSCRRASGARSGCAISPSRHVVPDSIELDPLLTLLREQGMQMAVVVDEYGGTDGVVTLEDLVEEIVGDIADEHDRLGAQPRTAATVRGRCPACSGPTRSCDADRHPTARARRLRHHRRADHADDSAGMAESRRRRRSARCRAAIDDEGDPLPRGRGSARRSSAWTACASTGSECGRGGAPPTVGPAMSDWTAAAHRVGAARRSTPSSSAPSSR